MLTPEYLDKLPDAMVKLWQIVEDDILKDIARRIKAMEEVDPLTPTAAWQAWRLEQTRASRGDVTKTLAKYSDRSDKALCKALQDAGTKTLADEEKPYEAAGVAPIDLNSNKSFLNLLNAGYRQTKGTWKNLTATTAKTVSGELEKSLDRAWLQVSSGAFDYNSAIRRAVDDLAVNMKYVTYPTGHRDTLEVAVRRCVLTGANQTSAKLQLARAEEANIEFVEVSAHSGARPTHAVWQGKVYHVGGDVYRDGVLYKDFETATGYGTGDGLCGWNCRHNFYPFWPGISERAYTDERIKELSDPTEYEQNQKRRALERDVRKYKRRFIAEQAAGCDTGKSALALRKAQQKLSDYIQETGGKIDGSRTNVQGFGYRQSKAAQDSADQFTKDQDKSIINEQQLEDERYANHPVTEQAIESVKPFSCDALDTRGQKVLAEAHKDLLRQVKDKPLGTEMARCYDLDMQPTSDYIIGERIGSVKIPDQSVPYIAIHNHPSGLTFSPADILGFSRRSNMRMLTVIGNDGTAYCIERTNNVDEDALSAIAKEVYDETSTSKKEEILPIINRCLEEMKKIGIEYHVARNR